MCICVCVCYCTVYILSLKITWFILASNIYILWTNIGIFDLACFVPSPAQLNNETGSVLELECHVCPVILELLRLSLFQHFSLDLCFFHCWSGYVVKLPSWLDLLCAARRGSCPLLLNVNSVRILHGLIYLYTQSHVLNSGIKMISINLNDKLDILWVFSANVSLLLLV